LFGSKDIGQDEDLRVKTCELQVRYPRRPGVCNDFRPPGFRLMTGYSPLSAARLGHTGALDMYPTYRLAAADADEVRRLLFPALHVI
jgi:hypothetical protein